MRERVGIAVAGTHGKSTNQRDDQLCALAMRGRSELVIGGTVPQLGGGSRSGASNLFVAEACEFDRSFHNLHPKIALITNIEEDHLDCYKDIGRSSSHSRSLRGFVPADGLIIAGVTIRISPRHWPE